jgi:hypothetical protein
MNSKALKYEPTIRQWEGELTENAEEGERSKNEIFRLQSRIKRLGTERVGWLQMIAVAKANVGLPLTEEERQYLPPEVKPRAVPADLCKGKNLVEAAEAFLMWLDEPATHREVATGIVEAGLELEYKSLDNSLRSAMNRSGKFVWFQDDEGAYHWGLPSWADRSPRATGTRTANEKPNLEVVGGTEAMAKSA